MDRNLTITAARKDDRECKIDQKNPQDLVLFKKKYHTRIPATRIYD